MCTSEQQTRFAEGLGVIPKSVHRFRQGHDTITEAIEMQTNRVKMLHFIGKTMMIKQPGMKQYENILLGSQVEITKLLEPFNNLVILNSGPLVGFLYQMKLELNLRNYIKEIQFYD